MQKLCYSLISISGWLFAVYLMFVFLNNARSFKTVMHVNNIFSEMFSEDSQHKINNFSLLCIHDRYELFYGGVFLCL